MGPTGRNRLISMVFGLVLFVVIFGGMVYISSHRDGHQGVSGERMREPNANCTYDVVWSGPDGTETWTGISVWCEHGGRCHGGSLHFVDPVTHQWIKISGTFKCTRVDRVERVER